MVSNQVATTLAIAYGIASVPIGASLVNYSAPWFWIGWVLAVLFFVIPLTAILLFIAVLYRFAKSSTNNSSLRGFYFSRRSRPSLYPKAIHRAFIHQFQSTEIILPSPRPREIR